MKKGFIILFVLPLVIACSDIENCGADLNLEFIVVRFFDKETEDAKKVGFTITSDDPVATFVIKIPVVVDGDTTGYIEELEVLALPLNANSNQITYTFTSDTSEYELTLSYDKEFSIFDPDCNPSIIFTNLDTLRQSFDSTVLVSNVTQILKVPSTKEQISNFEIYF